MRAVILAAGRGLRLNGACGDLPKCLLNVGGVTLIERQLNCLRAHGIHDLLVVTGFKSDLVRAACGPRVQFVDNPIFDQTNSLFSLWLTRDWLGAEFLVLNSDVLFHPALLGRLIECQHEDALLVSVQDDSMPPLGDEEMKVIVDNGRLVDISKSLPSGECDGENVGMAKFGAEGARLLVRLMEVLITGGGYDQWAPRVFQEFARRRPLRAIDTAGYPWIEIDFPEDYQRAVAEVFPRISTLGTCHKSAVTRPSSRLEDIEASPRTSLVRKA